MSDNPETPTSQPPATPEGDTTALPQWARDAISRGNNEAAKYRTEKKAVEEQHTAALAQLQALSGEKDSAEAARVAAEKELLKFRVAVSTGVPGDKAGEFAALLQGDDETSLKEHASKLLGLFGAPGSSTPPATDPTQGLGDDGTAGLSTGAAFFASRLRGSV